MNLTRKQNYIYKLDNSSAICGCILINGKNELSTIAKAVNKVYKLNDVLRICIVKTNGKVIQKIREFKSRDIDKFSFVNKNKLDKYAKKYSKIPLNIFGNLCEISIVVLPQCYGLLIKLHHIIADDRILDFI